MALRGPRISRCVGILGIPAVGTTYPDCVSCSSMVQAAVTAPRCEQGDRQRCRHSGLLWKAQGSNWGGFETRSSVALRVQTSRSFSAALSNWCESCTTAIPTAAFSGSLGKAFKLRARVQTIVMLITLIVVIYDNNNNNNYYYYYIYMAAGQNLLLCNKEGFLQAGATRSII